MNTKEKLLYTSWKKYIVLNDIDNNKTMVLLTISFIEAEQYMVKLFT